MVNASQNMLNFRVNFNSSSLKKSSSVIHTLLLFIASLYNFLSEIIYSVLSNKLF